MNHRYDVAVVGAGPSGATCAYYLARHGRRVALLDREQFPRDKLCGDAICANAQMHLKRMGVLQQILDNNEGHWAAKGGFISPQGLSFIGDSAEYLGSSLVIAVKRMYLDVRVARAAAYAGAELIERFYVDRVEYSSKDQCWTVNPRGPEAKPLRASVLVIADGALSRLARSLGLVNTVRMESAADPTPARGARISMPTASCFILSKSCPATPRCFEKRAAR